MTTPAPPRRWRVGLLAWSGAPLGSFAISGAYLMSKPNMGFEIGLAALGGVAVALSFCFRDQSVIVGSVKVE